MSLIGRGGTSSVHFGVQFSGRRVAVKWFQESTSIDLHRCFTTELKTHAPLKHKNIVTLLGYCFERGQRILVYDFMSNGTIRQHLDGVKGPYLMSWVNRVKVALEIASGIEYLHFYAVPPITHRDIKTTNVMLDDDSTAKLLDFGISVEVAKSDELPVEGGL